MTIEDTDDSQLPEPDDQPVADTESPAAENSESSDPAVETADSVEEPALPPPSLEDQLVDAEARLLRVRAEMENFRKRTQRDQASERQYAAMPLAQDLLAVIDNLGRALAVAGDSPENQGLVEGVQLVSEQLLGVLSQHGCEQMEVAHQMFDPNLHEAIGQIPSDEHPPGTILEVTQPGYRMHERVVRAPHVLIAAKQEDHQPLASEEVSNDDPAGDDETTAE